MRPDDPRDRLPQVETLLSLQDAAPLIGRISRPLAKRIARETLAEIRRGLEGAPSGDVRENARTRFLAALERSARGRLTCVLNGTGILLHTNLGRSPLSPGAWEAAKLLNTGYSNLELDLETGKRGERGGLVPELVAALAGTQAGFGGITGIAGLAVNNNAAAVLLALAALAAGREVIVSRGHAVQIGGGFRVPEILALSGARLVEVGTTNITTAGDYAAALRPGTAAVLVVHSSNFAIRGFAATPSVAELRKALPRRVALIVDQGSGCTEDGSPGETPLGRYLRDGADLVCFSADKMLGGPQAGLVAGRKTLVARLARHPLMRAFRPGKTVLSLLEATLVERLNGVSAVAEPRGAGELRTFGAEVLARLAGISPDAAGHCALADSRAALGGGTSPDEFLPSVAIEIRGSAAASGGSAAGIQRALRRGTVPLITRVSGDRVIVDLMALAGEDPGEIAGLLAAAAD